MNVGAEPDVVGQVPTRMVRIFIDHYIVAVPKPIAAIAKVIRGDCESEPSKEESAWTSASEVKNVMGPKAAGKVSVLPGMVKMIVYIAGTGVVTNPLTIWMDVRSVGVTVLVRKIM